MIWSKISSTSVLRCQVEFFQVSFECAFDREGLLRQWVRSLPPPIAGLGPEPWEVAAQKTHRKPIGH